MSNFHLFIDTFTEIVSIMILFNAFNKQNENKFRKSSIVVLVLTIVVISTNSLSAWISTFVNFFVFFFMIMLFFRKSIKEMLTEGVSIIVFIIIIEITLDTIFIVLNIFDKNNDHFLYDLITNIILIILSSCIYFFIPKKNIFYILRQKMNKMYFLLANLLMYAFLVKLIWEQNRNIILQNSVILVMIPVVIWGINLIFIIYNENVIEHKKLLKIYNQYNPIILDLIEEIRRRQHDFKNHLATIYGITMTNEEGALRSELQNYLKSLQDSFVKIDECIQIQNRILAAIVYVKSNQARQNKINFKYMIEDTNIKFTLKDYELSEVLNNLIDNAFEAVMKLEISERVVYLKVAQSSREKFIQVGNIGIELLPKDILKVFKKGFSTKKEIGHGYGLYSVKKIVQNHGGKIEISFEDRYLIFKVLFFN